MLVVNNLNKSFTRAGASVDAVCGLDFHLSAGEFVQIIGRSGSGKTTFLNLLTGLLKPDSGSIKFQDLELTKLSESEYAQFRNRKLAYIPQKAVLIQTLTVIENVILPYDLYRRDGDPLGRALYLLEQLGIRELKDSYPEQLSGGELRRVQIARALMNEAKLLVADEPTADLDSENTRAILELLKKQQMNGLTILLVTHELDTLAYGDSVYTMEDGRLYAGKRLLGLGESLNA